MASLAKLLRLCAFLNGRKDVWDLQLPLAVFAIDTAASTLGKELTPFFIDSSASLPAALGPAR